MVYMLTIPAFCINIMNSYSFKSLVFFFYFLFFVLLIIIVGQEIYKVYVCVCVYVNVLQLCMFVHDLGVEFFISIISVEMIAHRFGCVAARWKYRRVHTSVMFFANLHLTRSLVAHHIQSTITMLASPRFGWMSGKIFTTP